MSILQSVLILAMFAAGIHMAASWALSLKSKEREVANEIFATNNIPPGIDWHPIRLLLTKYYFPWVRAPKLMNEEAFSVKSLFFVSRYAGLAFLCAILSFLVLVMVQGVSGA